jgi:hypothetical protein
MREEALDIGAPQMEPLNIDTNFLLKLVFAYFKQFLQQGVGLMVLLLRGNNPIA